MLFVSGAEILREAKESRHTKSQFIKDFFVGEL
jgi:hypothetical protein